MADVPTDSEPAPWLEVLLAEHEALRLVDPAGRAAADLGGRRNATHRSAQLPVFRAGHSALCLSGGGIRSASFSVGVLQALARLGVLRRLDYLSTVSGGGFAGAWLTAWLYRARTDPAAARRARAARDRQPRGRRRRAGAGPAAAALHPLHEPARRVLLGRRVDARRDHGPQPAPQLARAPAVDGRGAARAPVSLRARALERPRPHAGPDVRLDGSRDLGAAVRRADVRRQPRVRRPGSSELRERPALAADLRRAVPAAALSRHARADVFLGGRSRAAVARPDSRRLLRGTRAPVDCGRVPVGDGARSGRACGSPPRCPQRSRPPVCTGSRRSCFPTASSCTRCMSARLFPSCSRSSCSARSCSSAPRDADFDVADLEWWSRFGAWVLIAATAWFVVSAVVFGGPVAFSWTRDALAQWLNLHADARLRPDRARGPGARRDRRVADASVGGARKFPGGPPDSARALGPRLRRRAARDAVVGRRAAGARAVAIAGPAARQVRHRTSAPPGRTRARDELGCHPAAAGFVEVVALGIVLLGFGAVMGRMIPVNKFSLAGMYRYRLVRSFLGASRAGRSPNPFTGFDPADDFPIAELAPVQAAARDERDAEHGGRHPARAAGAQGRSRSR